MIAVACDHGGYKLKKEILKHLEGRDLEYKDFGCDSEEAVDYPIYARKVTAAIKSGECDRGILICGTGIGISITANREKGTCTRISSSHRPLLPAGRNEHPG